MAGSFAQQIAAWSAKTERDIAAAWHASLRGLADEMRDGGNVPVVTGNLRNSLQVSTSGPPTVNWKTKNFRDPTDAINNAIAGAEIGATVHLGWRAPYAHKVEEKAAFTRLAAQKWSEIVDRSVRAVKGR